MRGCRGGGFFLKSSIISLVLSVEDEVILLSVDKDVISEVLAS